MLARTGMARRETLIRQDIAAREPETVAELLRLFRALAASGAVAAVEREALNPALRVAMRYCVAQGLVDREVAVKWGQDVHFCEQKEFLSMS